MGIFEHHRSVGPTRRQWQVGWILAFIALSLAVGAVTALNPANLLIVAIPALALGLILSAHVRLIFVVLGGLIVLSSSADLSLVKIGYLVGVGLSLLGALRGCYTVAWHDRAPERLLLATSLGAIALFGLSVGVAVPHGTPFSSWLRDVAPFVLFASAPILAIDASEAISYRLLTILFIAAAAGASAALLVELLSRREIIASARVVGLPSTMLPLAAGCYAASLAFQRKRWLRWAALGTVMLSELALAGSRSGLAALLVPVTVIALTRRPRFSRSARLIQVAGLSLILIVVLQAALTLAGLDTSTLTTRVLGLFQGTAFQDGSLVDRQEETRTALVTWLQDPLVGTGPGHTFVWLLASSAGVVQTFDMDTGLSFLSKFGLFGLVILAVVASGYRRTVRVCLSLPTSRTVAIALVAYVLVAGALLISQDPIEDKGFSIGLIFLLALALKTIPRDFGHATTFHDDLPYPRP